MVSESRFGLPRALEGGAGVVDATWGRPVVLEGRGNVEVYASVIQGGRTRRGDVVESS
jgi:hypothetical protein